MDNQKTVFKEEAYELLAELEEAFLELEERPDDADLVGRVFRAMHTIKGSGAMFGFDTIAAFTHEVETTFDLVREGRLAVTPQLTSLGLLARDHIKVLLDADEAVDATEQAKGAGIIKDFLLLQPPAQSGKASPEVPGDLSARPSDSLYPDATYRIRFKPHRGLLRNGTNPVRLLDELAGMGPCHIVAQTEAIPLLDQIEPEDCFIVWDVILTTDQGLNAIKDVFIFVEDDCDLTVTVIDEEGDLSPDGHKKLGEILLERGDIKVEELAALLERQKRIGELLVEENLVSSGAVASALLEQKIVKERRENRAQAQAAASIRVAADRLDTLVDLVGELVTVQARLSQKAVGLKDAELLAVSEEVERLVAELRDNTMSIRMLPIGTTFSKFKRLTRDLSKELGKEVVLTTAGGETELDKTVIEQLGDPLVHMIRNSIDHGIEPPQVRQAAGKPSEGTVHLEAVHAGANVLIRITDDGGGLDAARIRTKAIEKGLIAAEAELNEKEIWQLIFAPGFSTAEKVSGVSGRGVGMDVVKQRIETLRGSLEVESRPGEGTTVTMKLPLTLAIIDGFLVTVGDTPYVLPLAVVEECLELNRSEADQAAERSMINLRGQAVAYLSLRQYFAVDEEVPDFEQVVVTEAGGLRIGFGVDHFIGQHQTVIKSLGRAYRGIREISGATILGDGSVALILDVNQLVEAVQHTYSYAA